MVKYLKIYESTIVFKPNNIQFKENPFLNPFEFYIDIRKLNYEEIDENQGKVWRE